MTVNSIPEPTPLFRDLSDIPVEFETPTGTAGDTRNRPLRDLRISVPNRRNFRCVYWMPKEIFGKDFTSMQRDGLLIFEEITRVDDANLQGHERRELPGCKGLRGIAHEVGLGPIEVNNGEARSQW